MVLLAFRYLVILFPWGHAHSLRRYGFSQCTEGYETVWRISRERVSLFAQFLVLPTLLARCYHLPKFRRVPPSGSSPTPCRSPSPYLAWAVTHAIPRRIVRFFQTWIP
ncbi:hypothetical protein EDD16DRAFT_293188 [Pisolithus croceorrhizus]|nr:hypothetical protein EDD16DRAFT_293188 [Pisolithus croceorrhizus]